ncbi:MAG: hypothetical protein ACTSV2_03785 [Candidatus Thorarchaeota archaeon]
MVDSKTQKMTLTEIQELSTELFRKMNSIGHVSKEFWEYHDQLVPLLIFGITMARKLGKEAAAQKFEDLREEVQDNTPSGYWK